MNKFLVKELFEFDEDKGCPQPIAAISDRKYVGIVQQDGTGEMQHWVALPREDVAEFVDALVALVPEQFSFISTRWSEREDEVIADYNTTLKSALDYANQIGSDDGSPSIYAITTNLFVPHEKVTVSIPKDASDEEILQTVKAALK